MNPLNYAKAIGGALLAGLITLTAVIDPTAGPADVTFFQWLMVAVSVLGTGIGVYAIPNRSTIGEDAGFRNNSTGL